MLDHAELVIESQATLGECPCWHREKQLLYWVDILQKQVHIYEPKTNKNRTIEVGELVAGITPASNGRVIIGLESGFASLDLETEAIEILTPLKDAPPPKRFNDGKCDRLGRFFAGRIAIEEDKRKGTGSFYSLNGLKEKKLLDYLHIPNGTGWSPDDSTMYLIDSPTKKVFAFDYDLKTGHISNPRVAVTIPDTEGYPDGMAVDTEGTLWVALWAGFKVTRWHPQTGELLQSISVPAPNVTSCTFGGANLNELYITTARKDMDEAALQQYPQAGGVFRVTTDAIAMPTFEFVVE
jgi:sugar lactone lactonase YvrE